MKKDPIKNGEARVVTLVFKMLKGSNSIIGDGILKKFKFIEAFLAVLFICKNEMIKKNFRNNVTGGYCVCAIYCTHAKEGSVYSPDRA